MRFDVGTIVAAGIALGGCGASACPTGAACGTASWLRQTSSAIGDGRFVRARAVSIVRGSGGEDVSNNDSLAVGETPVYLRFDLRAVRMDATIDRAVLSLTPHPSWRPTSRVARISVWDVSSRWTAESLAVASTPDLGAAPVTQVTLSAVHALPLRLDVTTAVRAWRMRSAGTAALAMTVDGAAPVFAGGGVNDPSVRPVLEVVTR